MELNNFSNLNIPISIDHFWFLLGLVLFVFTIFSLVLIYHWHKYRMGNSTIFIAEVLFFLVSFLLIVSAVSALLFL